MVINLGWKNWNEWMKNKKTCKCEGISWATESGAKHPCKSKRIHGFCSYSVTPSRM